MARRCGVEFPTGSQGALAHRVNASRRVRGGGPTRRRIAYIWSRGRDTASSAISLDQTSCIWARRRRVCPEVLIPKRNRGSGQIVYYMVHASDQSGCDGPNETRLPRLPSEIATQEPIHFPEETAKEPF